MATNVEEVVFIVDSAGDAADDGILFQDFAGSARAGEFPSGRKPGGPGADDGSQGRFVFGTVGQCGNTSFFFMVPNSIRIRNSRAAIAGGPIDAETPRR
jgi:hypothetical protein